MSSGYSGTPLAKKLGIREGARVCVIGAPTGFVDGLDVPSGVEVSHSRRGTRPFDVIVLFVDRASEMRRQFGPLAARLTPAGGLWVGWPKKVSGVPTDLSDGVVRAFGLETGLVDNKVCAIDETWSGLRFVVRKRDR